MIVSHPQLLGGDAEGLEEPVGDGDLSATDREGGAPVEQANLIGEVTFDDLAAVGLLGGQLAAFGVKGP